MSQLDGCGEGRKNRDDFLKYLKRLSIPKKKVPAGEGKTKSVDDNEHFMVERNGLTSNLVLMPSYLKDYITEFNYLFHQIYKCRTQDAAHGAHEPFYGFGNNLRKFLEAFLFFKFPYHDDKNDAFERIRKFFGEDDATAIALLSALRTCSPSCAASWSVTGAVRPTTEEANRSDIARDARIGAEAHPVRWLYDTQE